MVRPLATGLATAFYRLYLLDSLASAPARPATLLATISSERLPLASGAFGRALQSLLEGGYLVPAPEAAVALTPLGAAERVAERERWRAVIPTILRLVDEPDPEPRPTAIAEAPVVVYRTAAVAESYLDRVLVGALRERVAQARDGGRAFVLVLGVADVDASSEATRRAIVHRCIRATLGGAATLFGGDTSAFRYGDSGVALIAPIVGDERRGARIATLLHSRIDELLRTMSASVRAFAGARWQVRVGHATWTANLVTSGAVLRIAQDALARDGAERRPAA
ncbi:MAG TPA: hypothetical protein VGS01_13255 [Candidatus Limnocylindria bacterium]|jgi:hypothetical protein|nr:hypothetical protein [Candidatus Limnocylindria bacterium]